MAEWKGLPEEVLLRIEAELCTVRSRRRWFAGSDGLVDPMVVVNAPAGMVGRLLDKVFEISKDGLRGNKLIEMISKGEVAETVLKVAKKPETDFAKLLKGKQSGYRWVGIARRAMMYVMTAEMDAEKAEVSEIAERIDRYFFRGTDQGCPRYFAEERRLSAHAWSYPELSGELHWLARSRQGRVVFVSGGPAFVEGDNEDLAAMLQALRACAEAGIKVEFVLPAAYAEDAANSLDRVRSETTKFDVHRVSRPLTSQLPSFLTPATRYLFLDSPTIPSFWVLRPVSSEANHVERMPKAYCGVAAEMDAFRKWLASTMAELRGDEPPGGAVIIGDSGPKKDGSPSKPGIVQKPPKESERKDAPGRDADETA